ncbi:MAG: diguanylate cyclase [Candidatus Manganitrophus sp.]|nr:MAG: diguanylate cyclase [Candidatus Manganitrophus sp.]
MARLTVSVGLATFPDDAETFEELIRNADRALYQAKLQGKNRVITFDNGLFS